MPKVYNKHHRDAPKDAVYGGRPSWLGNPFIVNVDGSHDECVDMFEAWLPSQPELLKRILEELPGRDLVCFCKPKRCHLDIVLSLANPPLEPRKILHVRTK